MRGVKNEILKTECVRLRVDERMSLPQIHQLTGAPKGSLFVWLKSYPLTTEERTARHRAGCLTRKSNKRKTVDPAIRGARPDLSKANLGAAAQQMICARMMMAGVQVFRPMIEDTPIDLLVLTSTGTALKCQCKYIYPGKNGGHTLNLTSSRNSRQGRCINHLYSASEVDFFIGYCLSGDQIYVIPFGDTQGRASLKLWLTCGPKGGNGKPRFDPGPFKDAYHLLK